MNRSGYIAARFWSRLSPLSFGNSVSQSIFKFNRRSFSSIKDVIVDPKSASVNGNVDIVNYSLAGLFIVGYNEHGFMLSNGASVYGPMASFPQNAFSWNINSAKDINEDSLSLFRILCPEIEVLVIGKGGANEQIDHRGVLDLCWKHKLGAEILPTPIAIGIFNFLNSEGRYVAAALIPPISPDLYDVDQRRLKQLEASRDLQLSIENKPKIKKLPQLKFPRLLKPSPESTDRKDK
ncbi:unnamed protein product [Mesocestoides corti]|uniref:Acyl-CoA_dh_1 domain-containing protein n=1 Tax=Mesocestoides corti TaxID=53468 RepID=A0A0R3U1N6_MESCO|nr:unnamed protein product [Mesocestoides corti]